MSDKVTPDTSREKRGKKPILRLTPNQAVTLAELHLKRFRLAKEWKDATPSNRFTLYSPTNKDTVSFYEIKISSPKRDDAGYIIVSANEANVPIICFSMNGKTNTEQLLAKCAGKIEKVVWHSPFYVTAEDQKGKVIDCIGRPPGLKKEPKPEVVGKAKPLNQKAKTIKLRRTELENERQSNLGFLWREVRKYLRVDISAEKKEDNSPQAGYASGTRGEDIEDSLYTIRYADGCWKQPTLYQISPGDPPNNTDHNSGCGPTAWAALVAYHNMHWEPDLLYGTHGARDIPSGNYRMTGYIKRLMMIFHDKLQTYRSSAGDGGATDEEDMEKGYQVIKQYLLHAQGVDLGWYAYQLLYQTIYDYARQMIYEHRHPCIVNYDMPAAGHYALGYAIAIGEAGAFTDYYVLVNNLHEIDSSPWIDNTCNNWVHGFYIDGVWSFHRALYNCPRKSVDSTITSSFGMSMRSLNDELYNVMYSASGMKIHIYKTSAKDYPTPKKNPPEAPRKVIFRKKIIFPPNRYHVTSSILLATLSNTQKLPRQMILPENATPSGPISICTWDYEMRVSPFDKVVPWPLITDLKDPVWVKIQETMKQIERARTLKRSGKKNNPRHLDLERGNPNSQRKISEMRDREESEPRSLDGYLGPTPKEILKFAKQLPKGVYLGPKPLAATQSTTTILGEILMKMFPGTFKIRSGPYLFMCWRGPRWADPTTWMESSHIHIALLEIPKNLDFDSVCDAQGELRQNALNFAHVVLPDRFKTLTDPAITIAQPPGCDPMLYVAYANYSELGGELYANVGHILVIKLDTFFEIARDGIDLWPTELSDPNGLPGLILSNTDTLDLGVLTLAHPSIFDWFWCPFALSVTHHDLDSDGQKVFLIWAQTHMATGTRLYGKQSYSFAGQPRQDFPQLVQGGEDSKFLKVHYADKVDMFFDSIGDQGVRIGEYMATGFRPSVCAAGKTLAWKDPTSRIFIGALYTNSGGRSSIIDLTDLLETTHLGPSLHFVTDKLGNRNIVLGWIGTDPQRSMNHRIFYSTPPISDFRDLPK